MWIFISHSTDESDAAGMQRLRGLETQLRSAAAGASAHDVLIDFQRLEPGFFWSDILDQWLAQCHSAIVLLTPRALKSTWVLKEATILVHRAALDPQFKLFLVLLDGVTNAQLKASDSGFSPLYLSAVQQVDAVDPAGIASVVQSVLGSLSAPETPLDRLSRAIASEIQGLDAEDLERICQRLTTANIVWQPGEVRAKRCAHELARAVVADRIEHSTRVTPFVKELLAAALDGNKAKRVLNLVAPLWVKLEAAALFADVAKRNLDARPDATGVIAGWSLAMNGLHVARFTADMYMRRVYLPSTVTLRTIEGGESDDRLADLTERIRNEVRDRERPGATDAEIDRDLATLTRPYFIVLPPPLADDALLRELRKQFPRVTFIAQADDLDAQSIKAANGLVPIIPRVDTVSEGDAYDDYLDAIDRIASA